ncbi:MAG: SpoIID/LytB domain-containing protein [Atribacterota bacterium]
MEKSSNFLVILFIFIIFLSVASINALAQSPMLRVGIFLDHREVELSSDSGFHIQEIPSMKSLYVHESSNPLKITANPNGIEINNQLYNPVKEIKIIPDNGGLIRVNNHKYRGEIEIVLENRLLNVINIIEMEKYLYGVLKKEISPEWPQEVLRAQAVAARTFALSNMNKFIDRGYNICATTNSQAYGGVYHEHPATNKAVNDTNGIVLTFQGEPINAVYHSDSGGCTENSEDVWGGFVPYLRSVPSDYEEIVSPPNHQWSCSFTEQEILEKLAQHGYHFNVINNIVIGDKTEAGRVKSVDIIGDNNKKITIKANDFRLLMNPTMIRSSLFTIEIMGNRTEEISRESETLDTPEQKKQLEQEKVDDILREERDFSIPELIELLKRPKGEKIPKKENFSEVKKDSDTDEFLFTFKGFGSGHGVGLSQWGAYGMASEGYSYEDILKYYYQGIQLTKLY